MSSIKIVLYIISVTILLLTSSIYFSEKNSSERKFLNMLKNNALDSEIIWNYLSHHQHKIDSYYDTALQLAALDNIKYLHEVIYYYTHGSFILNVSTANRILQQLPSSSTAINHAAGRIYSTHEFGHYNLNQAAHHLEYAALTGDKNAAETLSIIYAESACLVEAVTWAKVANSRDLSSECSKLPVDVNRLSNEEWDAVIYNEEALEKSIKNNSIASLKYSSDCTLTTNQ